MLENLKKYKIILASNSPRRKLLLADMGIEFDVTISGFDESSITGKSFLQTVELIAEGKAKSLYGKQKENELLIAADTIVVLNDKIIGKPKSILHSW